MRVYIRTFNKHVTGGEGNVLLGAAKRDAHYWHIFEELLRECLVELGHDVICHLENIRYPDLSFEDSFNIQVHKNRKQVPNGGCYYMQSHLGDLFTLDTGGWGVEHSSPVQLSDIEDITSDTAHAWIEKECRKFMSRGESKHSQPREYLWKFRLRRRLQGISPGYLLVPIQTPRDYTITEHSPVSVLEFIDIVGRWAGESGTPLVFKLHPYNRKDHDVIAAVTRWARKYSHVHVMSANIHHLIHDSVGVIVINSGTGFEALMHGKPVMTFGDCDYKFATHELSVVNMKSIPEYLSMYNDAIRLRNYRFVYYFCRQHGFLVREEELGNTKARLMIYLRNLIGHDINR